MLYTVDQQKLVLTVAQELKNHIEMPEWAKFVKTGAHRETFPRNADWWYIRAASILRFCHMKGPVGVSKLRTRYGGRKNRGVRPDKFTLASGKVIRVVLQQLEAAKLLKQTVVENHKGRVSTPSGVALLVKAAKAMEKTTPKPKAKKASAKKEETTPKEKKVESKLVEKKSEKPKAEKKPTVKKEETKKED